MEASRVLRKLETAETPCYQLLTPANNFQGTKRPAQGRIPRGPENPSLTFNQRSPHLPRPQTSPSPWQPLCSLLPLSAGTARPHGSVALSSGSWAGPKNSMCTFKHTQTHARRHSDPGLPLHCKPWLPRPAVSGFSACPGPSLEL